MDHAHVRLLKKKIEIANAWGKYFAVPHLEELLKQATATKQKDRP